MTDDLRLTILRAHNNLRTQLANGQVTDGSKQTLPTGQNIYKFVCLINTGHEFIQNLNRDLIAITVLASALGGRTYKIYI